MRQGKKHGNHYLMKIIKQSEMLIKGFSRG